MDDYMSGYNDGMGATGRQMNPRFISPNCILIEVLLTKNGANVPSSTPFPEQQQLVNRPIVAIESLCSLDMPYSAFNAGVEVVPPAIFTKLFLNIQRSGKKTGAKDGLYYRYMPLTRLRVMQNNDTTQAPLASFARDLFQVTPMYFSWPDSNLTCVNATAMTPTNYVVPFLIHYLLQGEDPSPYM